MSTPTEDGVTHSHYTQPLRKEITTVIHTVDGRLRFRRESGDCKNETVALLTYMLQHNEHHAAELDQMADNLKKLNMDAAARTIKEAVSDFQKGNMRLGLALTLVKEELK